MPVAISTPRIVRGPGISPHAGCLAPEAGLIDVAALEAAYLRQRPDPKVPAQRVHFGTSGHRGSAFDGSFNEWHVLAITQAICDYRHSQGYDGPLYLGIDTHALSAPACATALEVLAANGVAVMLACDDEFTPTPAVSRAIVVHNRGRDHHRADGIVMTPSHNPPRDGGYKYNPAHGGPAGTACTAVIEAGANRYLETALAGVRRMSHAKALQAATTHRFDFLGSYVASLGEVIDMPALQAARLRLAVDPMGGAGVHYWPRIAERYGLDLTVVNSRVDPTFRFVPVDWDGQIRMDPSSRFAMQRLISQRRHFDLALACDTDHDRFGVVTPEEGLVPADHVLAVAADYLMRHRPGWPAQARIGKTIVTTRMLDRVAARLGRTLFETPVGFKWFVSGLASGTLGFVGEESAGAAFLQRDGAVWTTDKDGMTATLLAAEITARTGSDPACAYAELSGSLGVMYGSRVEGPATAAQRARLGGLTATGLLVERLAGDPVDRIQDHAPGDGEPIGGVRVETGRGWFAARPSGTEDIFRVYAESMVSEAHLQRILMEARGLVATVLAGPDGTRAAT